MMTKTVVISRRNGKLVIDIESWPTNLPADRVQVALVGKYGDADLLALTDDELRLLRRALAAVAAGTKHTCNRDKPGHPLPFGRRDPEGKCPRCAELNAGATPREAPAWTSRHRENGGYPTTEEIDRHFASERHRSGGCGIVCTFGER